MKLIMTLALALGISILATSCCNSCGAVNTDYLRDVPVSSSQRF